ncbi:MAG: hypothetical protein HFH18_07205 [Ruminococcus sp.]|jgi:sugar O-acyltransferase (sialic acid O-acetyltransferase NeuD family)|nr:hypothetical protein [Ruminococcus sp.]
MRNFIIFGKGDFADILTYIIEEEMQRNVEAYTVSKKFLDIDSYRGKPVVPYEDLKSFYNPSNYSMALGYEGQDMYQTRKKMQEELTKKGFLFENVISESANLTNAKIGVGNIIMQNCLLAPFSSVGDGNVLWATAQIQHHNVVGNFNCIAPGVATCGYVHVNNHCFIGANATMKNNVTIADYTFVGAGAYISEDTKACDVIVPAKSQQLKGKISFDFRH